MLEFLRAVHDKIANIGPDLLQGDFPGNALRIPGWKPENFRLPEDPVDLKGAKSRVEDYLQSARIEPEGVEKLRKLLLRIDNLLAEKN